MNFRRGRQREEPEINLVPMIDVMLVILIFLMITTTYSKYTELQINLPTADAEKQPQRPNEISVVVSAQGQYMINKAAVAFTSIDQLAQEMRRAGGNLKDPVVIISADAKATHQSVVRVMEASRAAGLSQITFTTQATK
ncbi:MAG TPA: biopolymer transporter ExbD [Burkholderiales bacterium]|jgi:biopolymer transport protein ExbD|nr:biopolymer transporter ExbD [Burkholderiales bacterium]